MDKRMDGEIDQGGGRENGPTKVLIWVITGDVWSAIVKYNHNLNKTQKIHRWLFLCSIYA